jgi:hypothetical protein
MTWCPDAPGFITPPSAWGAAYADRYDPANGRAVITPCSKLIVHHSASNQPSPGGEAAFSRQLEAYGESRDGAACEYNFLLYPSGVLHGGFGDTRGCHASAPDPAAGTAYNSSSIGICFIGYFHPPYDDEPTSAAIATFQAWLTWMLGSGRLTYDALYEAPANGAVGWYGHRDVFATACPGDRLYPRLPDIIRPGDVPSPSPPPGGDDLVNTIIIVDDAYAKFTGDSDGQDIVHAMRYMGPALNSQIGLREDNETPRIPGTVVLHRRSTDLTTISLIGPKPTGDKIVWRDDMFYQGA